MATARPNANSKTSNATWERRTRPLFSESGATGRSAGALSTRGDAMSGPGRGQGFAALVKYRRGLEPAGECFGEAGGDVPDDPRSAVDHPRVDLHGGRSGLETGQRVLGGEDAAARIDGECASHRLADVRDD